MKKLFKLSSVLIPIVIGGCALPTLQLTVMSRNNGNVSNGIGNPDGKGGGTLSMIIAGRSYSGVMSRTLSNESFGFYQSIGSAQKSGLLLTQSGSNLGKAILSSNDGKGLRCDLVGDGRGNGSAICVDDTGEVYDVIDSIKK